MNKKRKRKRGKVKFNSRSNPLILVNSSKIFNKSHLKFKDN